MSRSTEAQPAVVLILKHLRRRGHGLKSHLTDWEKPGIKLVTPGLQDIGSLPTPWRLLIYLDNRTSDTEANAMISVISITNISKRSGTRLF